MKGLAKTVLALGGLLAATLHSHGQILTLNFGPNDGGNLQFNGSQNSFNFNAGNNGYQWNITSETGGAGAGSDAVGLNGSVLNGPFLYGPITTTGSGFSQVQSATVLGPLGNLVINDGSGNLTGTVN